MRADWTIARSARLTGGGRTDRFRAGTSGSMHVLWSISCADLAAYLLSVLGDPAMFRQTVGIAY